MIEVKILVRFNALDVTDEVEVYQVAEGLSNICDPSCANVWNAHGLVEFERLSYEQNSDIKFKAVKKTKKKEATA